MVRYFVSNKPGTEPIIAFFPREYPTLADQFKQALVASGEYTEDQITVSEWTA